MCCTYVSPPPRAPNATDYIYCRVPTNVMINETSGVVESGNCFHMPTGGYSGSNSLMCFADNGGWSCIGGDVFNIYRP